MFNRLLRSLLLLTIGLWGCTDAPSPPAAVEALPTDQPALIVLGIGQDGGVPQAGNTADTGWEEPAKQRRVVSLALVDPVTKQRWLFEATPDLPEQLHHLDRVLPVQAPKPGLDGVFLTHAHMGHYTGLMYFGHEVMGAQQVPVYAMPRMADYLRSNGPWSQLVRYDNIDLQILSADSTVQLNERLRVTPLRVPHRQEFSEVVGYRIEGPSASALFIPDIDSWEEWDAEGTRIEDEIAKVDVAYLDATFYANGEIPGRDMSGFPHPFITHSMARFANLPASEKAKVRFIHLNHTNPALWEGTEARTAIAEQGFRVADEGEWIGL
ncbi:MAG: hypothetical protein RhofKO_21360 [Rhodothermales bacterium]